MAQGKQQPKKSQLDYATSNAYKAKVSAPATMVTPSESNPITESNLQQALLQSMVPHPQSNHNVLYDRASRSDSFGAGGGGFGSSCVSGNGSTATLSSAQVNLVKQVLGSMGKSPDHSPPAMSQPAMSQPAMSQPAMSQPAMSQPAVSQPAVSQPAMSQPAMSQPAMSQPAVSQPQQIQGSMITQIVASLQAQQQAQQQVQIHAALARAFGSADMAMPPASSTVLSNIFPIAPSNNRGSTAHDLLSRMQLAQAVHSVASKVGVTQAPSVGVNSKIDPSHLAFSSSPSPTSLRDVFSSSVVATDVTKAGADELIKLQLEQEHHNRMIQLAQADRQERARLANEEAILKKQRRLMKKNGSNNEETSICGAISGKNTPMNFFTTVASLSGTPLVGKAAASFGTEIPVNTNAIFSNEADLRQKLGAARGAAIVPCRARGMPVDHNFKTAYFVVPDGIEHGDELMCSYPSCRQAGVKFRYCLHCKVPVAKRNFRNRHRHGVPGGEGGSISGDSEAGEEDEMSVDDEARTEQRGKQSNATYDLVGLNPSISSGANPSSSVCMPITHEDVASPCLQPVIEDPPVSKKDHIIVIPTSDKMSMKKKSGNVRVPCRARGMPMAHNFKTAYFIIPPNIQHGDELVCSFPSCRNAGAKFRYCLHCKVPVAKRNFRNRHKHANIGGADKKKGGRFSDDILDEKKPAAGEQSKEGPITKGNDEREPGEEHKNGDDMKPCSLSAMAVPYSAAAFDTTKTPESASSGKSNECDTSNCSQGFATDKSTATATAAMKATVSVNSSYDADKIQRWVSLLENKPNPSDKHAMAVWMLNLMNDTDSFAEASNVTQKEQQPLPNLKSKDQRENGAAAGPPKKKFKRDWDKL